MKSINKTTFFISLIVIFAMISFVCLNLGAVQASVDRVYNYLIDEFGWFFILSSLIALIFSLYIGFGPYKDIKLGGNDAKPAFKKLPWAAMMFTTSCGAWLIVYGFLEPIYCAADPAFQLEPLSINALEIGQVYAHYHWGPSAWCIYVPISIAIGFLIYNKHNKGGNLSDATLYCIDERKHGNVKKLLSIIIDVIAVISVVLSPVISIGTGMPLLTVLIQNLFGVDDSYIVIIQIAILTLWTIIFGTSVYLGLKKGIKNLSNANVLLALLLMFVVGLFTGLKFVFSSELNTIGFLFQELPRMLTYTDAFGDGTFVKGWTSSYWAVYFVYMPLMGVFNAKISKGRTLKELVFGQLVLCTLGCWFAMATFGNYSMKVLMNGTVPVAHILANDGEAAAILAILKSMPACKVLTISLLIVCFVFLATTMDSSSFAAAEITFKRQREEDLAPRWLRVLWSIVACVISFILLQVGGFKAVRSLCYIAGLPLAILLYLIIFNLLKMLKDENSIRKS